MSLEGSTSHCPSCGGTGHVGEAKGCDDSGPYFDLCASCQGEGWVE